MRAWKGEDGFFLMRRSIMFQNEAKESQDFFLIVLKEKREKYPILI